ncbi:MAG: hypothetical protein PHF45_00730 [Candidatus Pacebacteria bacterium]|nr:hypothetical protein [Candidatus Paceibacterota bacterium]
MLYPELIHLGYLKCLKQRKILLWISIEDLATQQKAERKEKITAIILIVILTLLLFLFLT